MDVYRGKSAIGDPVFSLKNSGEVFLDGVGEYWFSGAYLIRTNKYGRFIRFRLVANSDLDTIIQIPRITPLRAQPLMLNPDKYYNCDELCQGDCTDYYEDGTLRLEGHFIKGFPDGDLKFYVYQKKFASGETITLGPNGLVTGTRANYAVAVVNDGGFNGYTYSYAKCIPIGAKVVITGSPRISCADNSRWEPDKHFCCDYFTGDCQN